MPNIKAILSMAILILWFAPCAKAVPCSSAAPIGNLSYGAIEDFGNSFSATGGFSDCGVLTLSGPADLYGGVLLFDNASFLNLEVTDFSLFQGDVVSGNTTGALIGSVTASHNFTFSGLSTGSYSLVVTGEITKGFGLPLPVGYVGSVTTLAVSLPPDDDPPVVTEPPLASVPEPGSLALLGMGMAGLAYTRRRRG